MTYIPVDVIVDQKGKQRHQIDTLNLLAYVVLLVLVLVTTWYFKRKKRLYIHETGLAIIFGLIMGATLRYCGLEVKIASRDLRDKLPESVPADYIIIEATNLADKLQSNQTMPRHKYAYEFRGEVESSAKLGSQISYASVDPEVFFNLILPPIVLNAGLSLKRRHFFRNIGAIFSYAFIGTTISVAFVGSSIYASIHIIKSLLNYSFLADQFSLANCFYFGAIISPTDPIAVLSIFQELGVDVNLFALVFGESILNDAVSIVLTHSIDQFSIIYGRNPTYPITSILWNCVYNFISMFLTSCLIGFLFGIITSLTTKFAKLTETPLLETSLLVLMSYSSFLTAEVIDSSGIVAILLCGITQAHYTINNLSFEARERIKNLFELLTFLCENFLFLAVGVSFWQRDQIWDLSFIGIAFAAVMLARAVSIYPLTCLINLGRRNKIPCNFQHLITWGGAARGVISYSLAARNTVGAARRIMLSTTSVIVIFTVIAVGGAVDMMLKCLKIPFKGDGEEFCGSGGGDDNDKNQAMACYHYHQYQQEQEEIMTTNNPNWSLRPAKRVGRSAASNCSRHYSNQDRCDRCRSRYNTAASSNCSAGTPHVCYSSKFNYKRNHHKRCHNQNHHSSTANSTPILEIETPWNGICSNNNHNHHHDRCYGNSNAAPNLSIEDIEESGTADDSNKLAQKVRSDSIDSGDQQQQQEQIINDDKIKPSKCCDQQNDSDNIIDDHQLMNYNSNSYSNSNSVDNLQQADTQQQEQQLSPYENASLVKVWRHLDNNYIKPLLTNSHPTLMETLPTPLRGIARIFTSDEQLMRRPRN